ncbi:hypothetical protein [Streptomyces graminilatus]|uniref:hypothetical protein n=1 Tax=Streptomyces graminilatus TaxID=1464070 RepID=UPI000ADA8BD7
MAHGTDEERQHQAIFDETSAVVRLLPWPSPEGKPCFLRKDIHGGYLSRLADGMEVVQLSMGEDVLMHSREVIEDSKASALELRYVAAQLGACLSDALRVAESRGMRLPAPPEEEEDEADGGEVAARGTTALPVRMERLRRSL